MADPKPPAAGDLYLSNIASGRGGFVVVGIDGGRSFLTGIPLEDVNGDGLDDLLVVAPTAQGQWNAYVVFGKTDTAAVELARIDAGGSGGFVIRGDSHFGYITAAAARDMNGDGRADIALCGRGDAARCDVVYGKTDAAPIVLSDVGGGNGGFIIQGEPEIFDNFRPLASAGDVNGDGLPDLVIGEPFASVGRRAGRAFVVFGQTGGATVDLSRIADGTGDGFVVDGISDYGYAGLSVAGAGDVNGDGLADVIIGAPATEHYGDSRGHSYVVFGKTDSGPVDLKGVSYGFVIDGADYDDESGSSVASGGDVNGDGFADLLLTAPGYLSGSGRGKSYVVFGKPDHAAVELSGVESGAGGGYAIFSRHRDGYYGASIASVDDINGDGLSDLMVGCPYEYGFHQGPGTSYVVYGKTDSGPLTIEHVAHGPRGIAIHGESAGFQSGFHVATAGDVDGDGLPDLLISAVDRVYVVFGSTKGAFARGTHFDAMGTAADERFIGAKGPQSFVGGGGDDVFVGHGASDVLDGGSGSDVFMLDQSDVKALARPMGRLPGRPPRVARVAGGAGHNSIVLLGQGVSMDVSRIPRAGSGAPGSRSRIDSVQRVDLGRGGANQMHIEVADVQALTGMNLIHQGNGFKQGWRDGTYAFPKTVRRHQLVVDGAAGDALATTPGTWQFVGTVTHNGDGHEYAVYDSVAGHAQLIVDARLQLAGFQ